ncbi:unnamed protein product [Porites lobata]|uniref:RBR-type E3 ubiquitin transferase n=1 Tax=Porites lobata TaxID=104759 RepID=A0ABN8MU35_9CNID|nr:unnamed protein product [Porites lobata]
MAACRPIVECATCSTDTLLIITCESGLHTFCQECAMNYFLSLGDPNTVAGSAEAGLSCPLTDDCGSQLEFGLVRDILGQINRAAGPRVQRNLREHILRCLGRNVRIPCPNVECAYFVIQTEHDDFQELFLSCPNCSKTYCLTCKQCRASEGAPLAVKDPADCNTMRCSRCYRFYCFICSMDLGRESYRAHQAFPHRNAKMTEARQCWLVNDEEMQQTHETAIEIRQLIAVRNYLFSLDVSDERKVRLLERNRRILGNLHSALQEELERTKVTVNCVIV